MMQSHKYPETQAGNDCNEQFLEDECKAECVILKTSLAESEKNYLGSSSAVEYLFLLKLKEFKSNDFQYISE